MKNTIFIYKRNFFFIYLNIDKKINFKKYKIIF